MLEQKEILQNYTYIGHLSTHRLVENQAVFDQAMRSDLINMMVDSADASIEALAQESAVGLVIPDLPRLVRDGLFKSEPPRSKLANDEKNKEKLSFYALANTYKALDVSETARA